MKAALEHQVVTTLDIDESAPDAGAAVDAFAAWLAGQADLRALVRVRVSGLVGTRTVVRALSLLKPWLADGAAIACAEADFASVYDALLDVVAIHPEYRFEALDITAGLGDRPGRATASISFDGSRMSPQDPATVPANKNKSLAGDGFAAPTQIMPLGTARAVVEQAQTRWRAENVGDARRMNNTLAREFPDSTATAGYWHDRAGTPFKDFFTWGHDHDFGFGIERPGAMSTRHLEITSECVCLDMLPFDLNGARALNIGCWTGGDFLVLTGLGAEVTAVEEHPVSARAAARVAELTGCGANVVNTSLYADRPDWKQRFDLIYCSGVIYHVTDPLVFLRICFAYLKPGGRVILETKADAGDGSGCAYAGTREKGWNWYAPTREALGRWLVDAGFPAARVALHWRPIGRLLAVAVKEAPARLPDDAGFSRPGSWLEGEI